MESIELNQYLQVDIDKGEPEEMVISGLNEAGYFVKIIYQGSDWLRLMVVCSEQ